jgi:hypothetical protein
LKLLPGTASDEIACELVEAYIDDPPGYEGISYEWGYGTPCRSILVNDAPLLVTQRVFGILSERRSNWRWKFLWIDAIYINQQDANEKTAQVRMMREIFSKTSRVVVWLGPANDPNLVWDLMVTRLNPLMLVDPETRAIGLIQVYA